MRIVTLFTLLAACTGSTQLDDGFTECGDVTCAPGNYCAEAHVGACEPGCTSNVNCLDGEVCEIDDFFGTGVCVGDDTPDDTDTPDDPLAACQAACDHFQSCGLPAADASQCRSDCADLTDNQQTSIGNCGEPLDCDDALDCLGVDCFSDGDCGGGTCLDYTCL